ncbi:hypothetical protein TWF696_001485 [Orbilia brochopaga]|uniref:C2H2-type domain-containing protein n=1 Tax=Orbilia brochopaga TaxID=3140254 RepID=A0AAV9U8T7_9PEZI
MDPNNSQIGPKAKEATTVPVKEERVSAADQPSTRGWTATNQPTGQVAGQVRSAPGHAHARSLSIDRGITAGSGVLDTGQQQQNMGLQPSLHRQGSSQLPSFKSLISSVDDPNEKDPIPPITYNHNAGIESSSHPVTSSSPIRKQHICHSCKKTFPSKNSLSKHKQIHGERSHICSECSSKFHTKKDLTRHRDTVHASSSPNYVCPVLECARSNPKRAFSRRDNLRQHILQLHDKKYLEEIRNPQSFSPSHLHMQTDNTSVSPEGESSPLSDDLPPHTIDEVVEEHQPERIEVRTPIQLVIGEDEALEEEDTAAAGDKGKGRSAEYSSPPAPGRLQMPANRPHSPLESPRDVVMSTPKFLVQDFDPVPEQEPLEVRRSSVPQHSPIQRDEEKPAQTEDELDETWVINFLEGIEATELDQIAQLSPDGLKRKYPTITTQRRLNLIKFALRGFVAGFSRGYQCAHAAVFSAPQPAPSVSSRASLSVISPSHMPDGKASLSPLTPTSIAATSPTNRLGNDSGSTGIFGSSQQQQTKEPPTFRGESSVSFVVPHHPRANTAVQDVKPITNTSKAEDIPRPPPTSVATDAEGIVESYKCDHEKCGKTFTKKSEWKKHMQRHRRPFFCTFHWQERGEVQRFGSKDDWRRHEEHRHYQSEFYKCPGGSGDENCLSDFSGRLEFERHLEDYHKSVVASWTLPDGKINDDAKRDFLQRHHNGTDYIEDNFWCGFCAKLINIPPEMTGRRGKEIRVNHVADHFHKEQKDIRLWVKYNECNLADIAESLDKARKMYDRERNLRESDLELLDQHRQLPTLKEIFGPSGEPFTTNPQDPSPVQPDLWICVSLT